MKHFLQFSSTSHGMVTNSSVPRIPPVPGKMISSSSAYKLAANQLITEKAWSGKPFGVLLVLLRCLLGGSWGLLRRLGRLLGPLGSPLGGS